MKYYLLILVFYCSIGILYSQSTASGYYVTHTSDTIQAEIKIKKGAFGQIQNDFANEVIVTGNANESIKFRPSDIAAYGFTFEEIAYQFYSKPTKKGENKFLIPIVIGPKTSLFQYSIYTSGSGGSLSSDQIFYTFEKADGSNLLLGVVGIKKLKAELKAFYKENPAAQKLIDERLNDWLSQKKDLIEILSAVNTQ